MDKKKRLTLNLAIGKPGKTMDATSLKMDSTKSAAKANMRGTKSAANPFMNGSNSAASDKFKGINTTGAKGGIKTKDVSKYDSVDNKGNYYKKTLKKLKK